VRVGVSGRRAMAWALIMLVGVLSGGGGKIAPRAGGDSRVARAGLRATAVTGHVTGAVPTSCHQRKASNGQPLPDSGCTPGVVNAAVTQANLDATICKSGYSSSVRAPESETES